MRYLQFTSHWKGLTKLGLLCMVQAEYDWQSQRYCEESYANGFVDV